MAAPAVYRGREASAVPTSGVMRGCIIRGPEAQLRPPISLGAESSDDAAVAAPGPDIDAVREAAHAAGYEAGFEAGKQGGYAAGLALAEAETTAHVRQLASVVAGAIQDHASFYRDVERQVIQLALAVAQKVVEREIENVPDLAVRVIGAALADMDGQAITRVRVHPDDREVVACHWTALCSTIGGDPRVDLVVDPQVGSGGAVIETTHGQVDAQLESRLTQLAHALWTFTYGGDAEAIELAAGHGAAA